MWHYDTLQSNEAITKNKKRYLKIPYFLCNFQVDSRHLNQKRQPYVK